jgi:hypothetical protein
LALSAHVPDFGALEVLLGVARAGRLNSAAQHGAGSKFRRRAR